MKRFIVKTTILLLVPLLCVFAAVQVYIQKVKNIRVDDSIHLLVVGDSHTESSIDDSFLPNSINISQSSQHFLYTYNILRNILGGNPQITKVVLGVSFHSFSANLDEYLYEKNKTQTMYPRYYPILDATSIKDIEYLPLSEAHLILKNVISYALRNTAFTDYPFIGKFYKSKKSNLSDSALQKTILRHYYSEEGDVQGFSDYQKKYLYKIVSLCNERGVTLFLLNTPVTKKYYDRIPKSHIQHYFDVLKETQGKARFVDMHTLALEKECYGDADHINYLGSKKITLLLSEHIEK